MDHLHSTGSLEKMPFLVLAAEDPMPSVLEWLCDQLMEAEFMEKLGVNKHERSQTRKRVPCRLSSQTL